METNDWLILNNIIYKIYTVEDLTEMRKCLLEQLKLAVDYDSADFYLAGKEGMEKLTDPVNYNCQGNYPGQYDELDYSRGIMYSGKSMVYRETDIISDEKRVETEYYKKIYKPNHWHYSMQIILAMEKKFLGVITLYRLAGKENFRYNDIFALDMLKEHLSYRLYQEQKKAGNSLGKLSIREAAEKFQLTRREETILRLLMNGETNEQICEELVITVNTLKKHVLNLYRKLGINNRVQMFKLIRERE